MQNVMIRPRIEDWPDWAYDKWITINQSLWEDARLARAMGQFSRHVAWKMDLRWYRTTEAHRLHLANECFIGCRYCAIA